MQAYLNSHNSSVIDNQFHEIQIENEFLISQLHKLQEDMEMLYYYNHNSVERYSNEQVKNDKSFQVPQYYGAMERVKNDLPYRLGLLVVETSHEPKKILQLPKKMINEIQAFNTIKRDASQLPPLELYQDKNEAEKVKKHLTYKIGKTLVDGFSSPKGLVLLPVKMGKEILAFKKKK